MIIFAFYSFFLNDILHLNLFLFRSDLDLPANEVHLYTLAASLETAVRSTCSAAEAEELLKFLDIRRPTEVL